MTENESVPDAQPPEPTEPVAPQDPVTPAPVAETAPPEPPQAPTPPPYHTEEELKMVKAVDVLGNSSNETFYVDSFTGNQLRYVMTSVIIPGRNAPAVAIIDVVVGIKESEDKDPAKTTHEICRLTVPILRLLLCSKPSTIRLRNNGDDAWTKIAAIVKRLPTTAGYDTIMKAKDFVEAPGAPVAPPEAPAPAPEESKIILP